MRIRLAPLLLLLASACSPVIADTNDKGGGDDGTGGGDDVDTDVGEDVDTDSDTDDEDPVEDPGPSTEDWAGGWFASVNLEAEGDFGGGQEVRCEGDLGFEFYDDGEVVGDGLCSVGGWAEATLSFEGEVDADGNLDGILLFSQEWIGESELGVAGSASDESEIDTEVEGMLVLGGYEVPLYGDMVLERE